MPRPRIVVYAKDGANAGASYYRILQYVRDLSVLSGAVIATRVLIPDALRRARFDLEGQRSGGIHSIAIRAAYAASTVLRGFWYFIWDLSVRPDVVIISRSLLPRTFVRPISSMYALMLRRAGKVIWDFDDDIVASREIGSREFYLLCGASDIIVVTHTELRRVLPAAAAAKAITLSTTDGDFRGTDFNAVLEDRRATLKEEFRIVWVATSASISDLISVAEALDKAAGQVKASCGKRVVLEVVCNVPLVYDFVTLHLVNSLWSRETAREALLKAHLGIMPLLDSQFARGKGGFKLVQYLAAGLPAIASRVGFNAVVVADGETGYLVSPGDERGWVEAIAEVACHEANWAKLSYASLLRFRDSFSYEANLRFWLDAISSERGAGGIVPKRWGR